MRNRWRFNLGLRFDQQASYLPEETAPQSRFFPDQIKQAETDDLISWNNFSPRLGVIYDLTGSAKTLVKAAYSRYYWQIFTTKTGQASLAGTRTYRYTWLDLNNDRRFTTNELGALRSVDDPATRPISIDPDLEPTFTDEFTAGVVHELMPNVSLSGTFIARNDKDFDWRINRDISVADYTAVERHRPGSGRSNWQRRRWRSARVLRAQRRQADVVAQLHHDATRLHAGVSRARAHAAAPADGAMAGGRLGDLRRAAREPGRHGAHAAAGPTCHHSVRAPGRPANAARRGQDHRHAPRYIHPGRRQADGELHVPVPPVDERLLSIPGGLALHAHGQRGECDREEPGPGQRGDSLRHAERREL